MSKRKGRVLELETQIRNLKVRQGRILKASKNNHNGLLHWKGVTNDLIAFLSDVGIEIHAGEDGGVEVAINGVHPKIREAVSNPINESWLIKL